MKCSEWLIKIGFKNSGDPDKVANIAAAQYVLNDSLGGDEKLLTKYGITGRFIVARCKLKEVALERTGGINGNSPKLNKLSRGIAETFPTATDIEILGYYVNDHRTCQWKWYYDVKTNSGRLALIPAYLQNKMCTVDMSMERFSAYLADWFYRMAGHQIGEIE